MKDDTKSQNSTSETTPEISIVIPVYNGSKYLRATIDSIFKQTFQDFEIIFVNDGSTDDSLNILESYQEKHPNRITIINQKNSGPGVARNRGIKQAKGKYLSLLDADDLFEPNMLQLARDKITADQGDLVVYGSNEYLTDEHRYIPTDWTINHGLLPGHQPFAGDDVKENIFGLFIGWPWDKLYRTAFVKENNLQFQDLRSSEDALFVFMSIVRAKKISTIDQVLVHHRRVASSVSHTRETNWDSFYKALIAMRDQLRDWHLEKRYERDFVNYALNFSLWHLMTLSGAAYEELFAKLKTSWWQELGVDKHKDDEQYFYNNWDYQLYRHVLSSSPCEFQYFLRSNAEHDLSLRDARIYELVNSTTWKIGRFCMLPVRIVKRLLHR